MSSNYMYKYEMRLFLNIRLINLCMSLILGFVFVNLSHNFTINKAYAACEDTAGPSVDWQNCRKRNLIMDGFDFTGSNFTRSDMSASDLRNSKLSKSVFIKTNLIRASLAGSIAENVNFEGVIASRTDFSKGNYKNSSFTKAEISRADFTNSNLENATMTKADFSRVNFLNANLKGANLSYSNISRSNLINVTIDENFNIKGSYMFLTRIDGLDLSALQGLEQWQIDMACGNGDTKLPNTLTKPKSWPCKSTVQE